MTRILLTTAALTIFGAGAAVAGVRAGTYSIQTSYCDHLTVTVDASGNAYGASDVPNCDQSEVTGTAAQLLKRIAPGGDVIQVGGDLGYSGTEGWSWDFNLKSGNAELRGSDGTNLLGPVSASFTYTYQKGTANVTPPANNGRPSAVSVARPH